MGCMTLKARAHEGAKTPTPVESRNKPFSDDISLSFTNFYFLLIKINFKNCSCPFFLKVMSSQMVKIQDLGGKGQCEVPALISISPNTDISIRGFL